MGQSIKELRQRITGVGNIQKITRAMEMVAATKLRRLQTRAEGTRPYADTIRKIATTLVAGSSDGSSPLTRPKDEVKKVGLLVISSDRGLCGSYNSNVFKAVAETVKELQGRDLDPKDALELYTIGSKARQHFARRLPIHTAYTDPVEKIEYRLAADIAREISGRFEAGSAEGGIDEVRIIYTAFRTATRQESVSEPMLPIDPSSLADQDTEGGGPKGDLILEPSPEELLELLLPKSLAVRIYSAVLDSLASEFASRRVAMKAATDAAGDMIKDLRRVYNKVRQENITTELLDIVGGAEAL